MGTMTSLTAPFDTPLELSLSQLSYKHPMSRASWKLHVAQPHHSTAKHNSCGVALDVLVEFLSGQLQPVTCLIEIGLEVQGQYDEVSGFQRLNNNEVVPVATADLSWTLVQELVYRLQMMEHDALI